MVTETINGWALTFDAVCATPRVKLGFVLFLEASFFGHCRSVFMLKSGRPEECQIRPIPILG